MRYKKLKREREKVEKREKEGNVRIKRESTRCKKINGYWKMEGRKEILKERLKRTNRESVKGRERK